MEHQKGDKAEHKKPQTINNETEPENRRFNLNANRENNGPASHDAKLHAQPG